ncbi:MAG: SDR family oxidoreductase, partial [SAR202 cluster bacterium]|nr:SDR family oxidoreductase [SAR202 cluster bacterium]
RVMVPQRSGSIITLGSIHGITVADARKYGSEYDRTRSRIPYEAAKGSIINLTRSLAQELGRSGINVNCISPGQIPRSEHDAEQVEQWRTANVLERTGVPDDLRGAVALLASSAGTWITGHNLVVDGGITIV